MATISDLLLDHEMLWLVLAVYLGTVAEKFFEALMNDVIWPVLDAIFDLNAIFEYLQMPLRDKEILKFGDAFRAFLKLIIGGSIILAIIAFATTVQNRRRRTI